jgi:hypothetical protein
MPRCVLSDILVVSAPGSGLSFDLAESTFQEFLLLAANVPLNIFYVSKSDENSDQGEHETSCPVEHEHSSVEPVIQDCFAQNQHRERQAEGNSTEPSPSRLRAHFHQGNLRLSFGGTQGGIFRIAKGQQAVRGGIIGTAWSILACSSQSGRGLPHSKTLREIRKRPTFRQSPAVFAAALPKP